MIEMLSAGSGANRDQKATAGMDSESADAGRRVYGTMPVDGKRSAPEFRQAVDQTPTSDGWQAGQHTGRRQEHAIYEGDRSQRLLRGTCMESPYLR